MREHNSFGCKRATEVLTEAKMSELISTTTRKRSISAANAREACETEELDAATATDMSLFNFFLETDIAFRAAESGYLHK